MQATNDDDEIRMAVDRWQQLNASLDEPLRAVLDRIARGETLKSVCFDVGLNYETVQKRIRRSQLRLGLSSTALFLHVWMTVRGLTRDPRSPVVVRHADAIARHLAGPHRGIALRTVVLVRSDGTAEFDPR